MNKLFLFLKAKKRILGKNERNLSFTLKYNKGRARHIADDKWKSYKILKKHNIPTPEILKIVRSEKGVNKLDFNKLPESFVIKPAMGTGGTGNLLIFGKSKKHNKWIGINGKKFSEEYLKAYCLGILNNTFSLEFAKQKDKAIIQERIKLDPSLKRISYKKGLPDIRIIIFKNIPIMAMLRLPTSKSGGKSNLHLGGVAAGIDLATGTTTYAVTYDRPIEKHPDTGVNLSGFIIPKWRECLKIAIKAVDTVGLKFAAVDVVLDVEKGPMVLELNTRGGLAIQIANREGLKGRLARVKGIKPTSLLHARKIGMNLFGGEVEETVVEATGMQVVGFISTANFIGPNGEVVKKIKVKNDSGALYTSIDRDLAIDLGYKQALEDFDALGVETYHVDKTEALKLKKKLMKFIKDHPEIVGLNTIKSGNIITIRPKVRIKIEMEGVIVEGICNISDRSNMVYKAIVGRRELKKNFLVDSNKIFSRYLS